MCYLKPLYFNSTVTFEGNVIYKMPYSVKAENDSVAIDSIGRELEIVLEEKGYTPGEIGCMAFDIQ